VKRQASAHIYEGFSSSGFFASSDNSREGSNGKKRHVYNLSSKKIASQGHQEGEGTWDEQKNNDSPPSY